MGGVKDGWLIGQFYKVASSYQKAVVEYTKVELDKMIKRVVAIERKRIEQVHSVLSETFFTKQRQLFSSIPSFDDSLLKQLERLEDFKTDTESLNAVLDDLSLKRHKKSRSHRSSIMNRGSLLRGITESPDVESIEDKFGDPFKDLERILLSRVVELKGSGGLGGMGASSWTTALVVVTKHGLLHIFELPKEREIQAAESSSAEAFNALRPESNFDSATAWTNGRQRGILQTLSPVTELDFRKCNFSVSKIQKREVQVTEESEQKSRNRFFRGNGSVKCTMRLASGKESVAWIEKLRETKKSLAQGPKKEADAESKEPTGQNEE
eukprot:scaffold2156_cov115-Cylindrotheca_fusiformis.AAC.7